MTKFQNSLALGLIQKVPPDPLRAKSLLKASKDAVHSAKALPFEPAHLRSIMRELYEGLRVYCEAIGYLHGFKFSNHESLTPFIAEFLQDERAALRFDKYRKIRNGITYYGDSIAPEFVKDSLHDLPELIKTLEKHTINREK